MHVSVICACMPGMTAFVRRVSPRLRWSQPGRPQLQDRHRPRTRRSFLRRLQHTLTRLTAARVADGASIMQNTQALIKSQSSTADSETPEYHDYLVYAPSYTEAGDLGTGAKKGTQLSP